MQELKAEKPIESPEGSDPVTRLMGRLAEEGFKTDQSLDDWKDFGEIIYARPEKISIAQGETIFIFTRVPELNERILRQTAESVVNTYRARRPMEKALSVRSATRPFRQAANSAEDAAGGRCRTHFLTVSASALQRPNSTLIHEHRVPCRRATE